MEILDTMLFQLGTHEQQKTSSKRSNALAEKRDVCPEVFLGEDVGYPWYRTGWLLTNCTNAKPIQSVISILINAVDYSNDEFERLSYVLNGISESYPTVDIFLAVNDKQSVKDLEKYRTLKVFKQSVTTTPILANTWNMLVEKASTPYVLIARDVIHFSWLSQLERQIRIVSEIPNVGIAGGSSRNLSGHWKIGCYQSTMKNYVLEYQEGYFYSRNESMYCDYLQGPFVARKNILKFNDFVNDAVIFEDLFHTLRKKGTLILGCPDAMYFTRGPTTILRKNDRKVWKAFAKKWQLNRIRLSNGVVHSFSCEDIDFKCDLHLTRSILLPVCCQEQYEHALRVFQDFANKHGFPFELDTGSALGTVKYNGLMPWDVDGDVRLLATDIAIFNKPETIEHFRKNGLRLTEYEAPKFKETIKADGSLRIKMPDLHIELWGRRKLTCPQYLPKDLQKNFTLALVRGTWVKTVFSPGLFVRNRYGVENLRHSQSWIIRNMKHSSAKYEAGQFLSCEDWDHHSCIHLFPADGNIPFFVL